MRQPGPEEWALPTIDLRKCRGHGRCVDFCPSGALILRSGRPELTEPERCSYCGICEDLCPEGAIALSYEIG